MAKKPKPIEVEDLTDEEIEALAPVVVAEPISVVFPVEPVAEVVPALHFITSFNQTSLMEANRVAREQRAEENALIVEAQAAALEAIAKVLKGQGDPLAVFNSLLAKPR